MPTRGQNHSVLRTHLSPGTARGPLPDPGPQFRLPVSVASCCCESADGRPAEEGNPFPGVLEAGRPPSGCRSLERVFLLQRPWGRERVVARDQSFS